MSKASERRIPCLLHIPGIYPGPERKEIEPEKLDGFLQILDRQFGGSTPLGIVPGRWLSGEPGDVVESEPMHRIEVAVKKKDLGNFERVARRIGKEMKQKVIYVVINYRSEVRFLFIDENDEGDESQNQTAGN
jgi:hypothetical protein